MFHWAAATVFCFLYSHMYNWHLCYICDHMIDIPASPGLILGLHPANERRRYKVTQTWNQSWSFLYLYFAKVDKKNIWRIVSLCHYDLHDPDFEVSCGLSVQMQQAPFVVNKLLPKSIKVIGRVPAALLGAYMAIQQLPYMGISMV